MSTDIKHDNPSTNNFIHTIITDDLNQKKHRQIYTRFPPEPNGYLHIGHAKSICLNFGIAKTFNGKVNLRFDDTNPDKESVEYIQAIEKDIHWLGFQWHEKHYASDYFEQLFQYAVALIKQGLAYVDSLSAEEIRDYRGTLNEPGKNSPFRNRSTSENLHLLTQMRAGKFKTGTHVLRAKIDMASPQIVLRDPVLYRIKYTHHFRTANQWCIYPTYDFTHCISDAIEGITHSLCTLEFQDNRAVYDWILTHLPIKKTPQQYEFSRLNLEHTVLSKRKLNQLVENNHVNGWDDPRLPTISGLRRRGYPPQAIQNFCQQIGITKKDSLIEMSVLENAVRNELENTAKRIFGILNPLKVVITNFDANHTEWITVSNHPKNPAMGTRKIPLTREIFIDHDDFMLTPPKKFFRLGPEREVRLRYAYAITCNKIIQDNSGNIVELHCSYDPDSNHGKTGDGRKIKGIIHWVSVAHAINAEIRCYDRLFRSPNPTESTDFIQQLNPNSLMVLPNAKLEPSINTNHAETRYQFERVGYFWQDYQDSTSDKLVLNQIVSLRDSWAKLK